MNSTAVVIGAMLISPLMGGIMAIAYGIAVSDLRQAKNSAIGLLVQILVCLASLLVLLALNVPKRSNITLKPEVIKRVKRTIVRNSFLLIIPSLFFGYQMVMQEMNTSTGTYESI